MTELSTSEPFWKQHKSIFLVLIVTFIAMFPVVNNDFVNWDDPEYIHENPLIRSLDFDNVKAMFTTDQVNGAYHPLTLLSWAIDYEIAGGTDPAVFHWHSFLLHLCNTGLVYIFLLLLLGNKPVAALSALLFGIHPMHVEAVAWISSRKDVLYAFYFLLSLIIYLRYLRADKKHLNLLVYCFLFFLLSLFSKGMAIMLPVVMLLIDFLMKRTDVRRLLLEKVPFIILAGIFFAIGTVGQQKAGAMEDITTRGLDETVFVGAYGAMSYIVKAVVPYGMTGLQPYHQLEGIPWFYYASAIPLALILFFVLRRAKQNRLLVFGFGFFLITVAPVLQIFPFGLSVTADRFTYIPYIGLFLLIAIGINKLWEVYLNENTVLKNAFLGTLIALTAVLGYSSFEQAQTWKNGDTFWARSTEVYPDSYMAWGNRAEYWWKKGNTDKALRYYDKCLELEPRFFMGWNNRGLIHMGLGDQAGMSGDLATAEKEYNQALSDFNAGIKSGKYDKSYMNRGIILSKLGRHEEGLADMNRIIGKNPGATDYFNRGNVLFSLGRDEEALSDFNNAKSMGFRHEVLFKRRAMLLDRFDKPEESLNDFVACVQMNPNSVDCYFGIGRYHLRHGDWNIAINNFNKALTLDPSHTNSYVNRGLILLNTERYEEATKDFDKAIELEPNNEASWRNKALTQRSMGHYRDAAVTLTDAIKIIPNSFTLYKERILTYLDGNLLEEAIGECNRLIGLNPNNPELHFLNSRAHYANGDLAACITSMERAENLGFEVPMEFKAQVESTLN